ncbi:MAG TPA: nitroreductase family protein [Bacteroidales bacterium]|nr:nitroreductase family protein [Bacteroidales bacterium]
MKLAEAISLRWSPRAFDLKEIDTETINSLFEAARWAPSSMNEQPWQYYYATRDDQSFNKFVECLMAGNQVWAKEAPLLILCVAKKRFAYNNRINRHALHDAGAASVSIAIQAAGLGLQVHQMGGFDMDETLETFNLNIMEHEPVSFIAVGYPGDPESLSEELRKKEKAPRNRKEIGEFVKHVVN